MSAVQIAGCSGAGKSAVAALLARRGLVSIDADGDPLLARFVDSAGAVVAVEPAAPDLAWLARHRWAWDPARLDELILAAAPATLYVCGGADNQHELAGRFTQVFLLEIDEPTMLARLDARRDHTTGAISGTPASTCAASCRHCRTACARRALIPIDARQPLDQVVDAISRPPSCSTPTSSSRSLLKSTFTTAKRRHSSQLPGLVHLSVSLPGVVPACLRAPRVAASDSPCGGCCRAAVRGGPVPARCLRGAGRDGGLRRGSRRAGCTPGRWVPARRCVIPGPLGTAGMLPPPGALAAMLAAASGRGALPARSAGS